MTEINYFFEIISFENALEGLIFLFTFDLHITIITLLLLCFCLQLYFMSDLVRNIFADFCELAFEIHAQISANQLKDISNTSECFSKNKKQLSFTVFDIESFYPSISKNVFMKAIQFN